MQFSLWLLGSQTVSADDFQSLITEMNQFCEIDSESMIQAHTAPATRLSVTSTRDLMSLKSKLQAIVNQAGLDLIIKSAESADIRPRLIIMDMDSTLVQAETIDQIANHAGVMAEVSAITESAMRGELDFTQSLKKRVAMLEGLSTEQLEAVHDALPLTSGAENLIRQAITHNCYTVLVSGGFTHFAQPIADRIGIREVHANYLEFIDGHLTGKVTGEIVDAEYKRRTLLNLIAERDLQVEETIAIGDGANDLLMLGKAGTGIAFHGKPKVQAESQAAINIYGLEAVSWWLGW